MLGFPVSRLAEPTMRLDYDCFNGHTSVGVKYERLEIEQSVKEEKEDEEMAESYFGGGDSDIDFMGNLIKPMYKQLRKFYRRYLSSFVNYLIFLLALLLGYELFVNRRVHKPYMDAWCKKKPARGRAPEAARDIARQERIRLIQERLAQKN